MKANWFIINDKLVLAGIQKNASTSIASVFNDRTNGERALTFPKRLAFFRHPLDRLVSYYRMEIKEYCDWHVLVDQVLLKTNVHWAPQVDLVKWDGILIPNLVYRFEDMGKYWSQYIDKPLPIMNTTDHTKVPPFDTYRMKELREYYLEDLDLWASL